MKTFNINVLILALGITLNAGAMAEGISKSDYKAGKDKIALEYKASKANCAPLAGNLNDICVAGAKGQEKVALAELEASYKPTRKNRYLALVAKADADYAVANEKCDDVAGNVKDVCVKEAKAVQTSLKANAKAELKTSDANATARTETSEARKDATTDTLDAQYKVAKEKCDVLAGGAKEVCVNQAKARFGK
ncbi:MAG: hypothetical protein Q8M09_20065 [Pseudomonadota bacterium]|nr:hypothetical protein [Pseudomonadota bacterium]MDP1906511.1 hypothetical protein [Pseudomonadota bacterium]MDP2351395.1 hypothetical protein [Pseudomonadota bacterium]